MTLEKVLLDSDGDPEDYKILESFGSDIEAFKSALQAYLGNGGSQQEISNLLDDNSSQSEEDSSSLDYGKLWEYFQQGGSDIWNEEETVYLGTTEGDSGAYIVEVNGPEEYGVPYCSEPNDMPRIVDDFIKHGGTFSSLLLAIKQATLQGADGEDEEHSIYIKTEPGGRIAFGELDSDEIRQLQESIATRKLSAELEELRDNSCGTMNECEGVVNSGDVGDSGNEGTIAFSENQPALGPNINDDSGVFEDGVYVVLMRLSKCSIEFEFTAKGGFDEDELEEISVPVRLPEEIVHGLYGHPDYNIITGFRFRGEPVDEYEGEVVDRGYEDQFTFFVIKDGETTVLYSNYNGEEEWCDKGRASSALSSFI